MRNPTNLSVAGYYKWLFIILSGVTLFKAYQGLVQQKVATGAGRSVGSLLTGREAVVFGLQMLATAGLFAAVAWALWFFWQRHED